MGRFRNPSRTEIDDFLRRIRSIAVVGISANTSRPSFRIARALQAFGYRVVPVNPTVESVLGERCWPSLDAAAEALVEPIDLVNVFRLPQFVAQIVNDCLRLKLPALWLQDGVIDEAAALRAQAAGMFTVMDRCLYRDRAMLAAG